MQCILDCDILDVRLKAYSSRVLDLLGYFVYRYPSKFLYLIKAVGSPTSFPFFLFHDSYFVTTASADNYDTVYYRFVSLYWSRI